MSLFETVPDFGDERTTYEEDYSEERAELIENLDPTKEEVLNSSWTMSQIVFLGVEVDDLMDLPEINANQLWKLSVKLGRLARKLDLSGSSNTPSTLAHLKGLLMSAVELLQTGHTIHLLEGISDSGHQLVSDVDIFYSMNGQLFQADYTNMRGYPVGTISVIEKKYAKEKYGKLKMNSLFSAVPLVITMNISKRPFDTNFVIDIYDKSPREDDFQFADKMIDAVRSCTWSDAATCLNLYSAQVHRVTTAAPSLIESPKLTFCEEETRAFVSTSGVNNRDSALAHSHFLDLLRTRALLVPDASKRLHKFFALEQVREIENTQSKRLIPLPAYERHSHHRSPFDRLMSVIEHQVADGINVLLFWKAVANCDKDYKPMCSFGESSSPDFGFWYGTSIKREVNKDGDYVSAYTISFAKGNNMQRFQTLVKGLSMYTRKAQTHDQLESEFDQVWKDSMRPSVGSMIIDEIENMIPDVMEESTTTDVIRGLMKKVMQDHGRTQIMTQLSQLQEVTNAILAGVRKYDAVKRAKGHFNDRSTKTSTITMGLDSISDLSAVVTYNLGPLQKGKITDVSYMVYGKELGTSDYTYPTYFGASRMLSMSHAQLDWNVTLTHKAMSWMSMIYENYNASKVKGRDTILPRLPLFLMFLNNNKFSQAAESVRYLFVNGISLSSGPEELFKKISWYSPERNLEKLYMLRMYRMAHILSANKSLGGLKELRMHTASTIGSHGELKFKVSLTQWNIAMPDDDFSPYSEQSLFDSFYVCKALSIQRYNKLVSEALILDKQLVAREKYLHIKSLGLPHEGRALLGYQENSLLDWVSNHIANMTDGEPYAPSPLVVALGILATTVHMKSRDKTVGETIDRVYGDATLVWQMDISGVLNNRGSVLSAGKHGVSVTKIVKTDKGEKKITQNAKCYETVLKGLSDMCEMKLPAKVPDWKTLEPETVEGDRHVSYSGVSTLMDKMWPLVYYYSANEAACVSKAVHKDQLGAREIAVLNAASRVMCKYTETFARHIRDSEHKQGMKVNLIERKDKSDIILQTLYESNDRRRKGETVMYDSADCSKWGPTMMMHILYLVIGVRVKDRLHRNVLRNCYALFGNKVFKIPDEFYLSSAEFLGGKDIRSVVREKIRNMPAEMGSFKNQIIYLEESMHQGICGCASSVLGTDAQNLSNWVTSYNLRQHKFTTLARITSDDYSRVLCWSGDKAGVFKIGKTALNLHYKVLLNMGIKRNLEKSGLSDSYWEFNSEFYCPTGEIRPDIKSRLSYIDFCTTHDPYDVALKPVNMAAEFLRVEGSLLGACWVALLNNHLAMVQNQSRHLYNKVRKQIYEIPLELGGLVKPDPIMSSISSSCVPLLKNYECVPNADPAETLSIMLDFMPATPTLIQLDDNGSHISIPSFSRSGVISLSRRPDRGTRQIREFLLGLDEREFIDAYENRRHGSLILALIACAKREATQGWNDGPAMNYCMSQVSYTKPNFKVNNNSKMMVAEGLISREDIHAAAIGYLLNKHKLDPPKVTNVNTDMWVASIEEYRQTLRMIEPQGLSLVPRHMKKLRYREDYVHLGSEQLRIQEFDNLYLPKVLGGWSDIHPWHYLESKVLYVNRIKKLTMRRQEFRMALRDRDEDRTNLVEKICLSNFAGGCRLEYNWGLGVRRSEPLVTLHDALSLPNEAEMNPEGVNICLLSGKTATLLTAGRVRSIDLTNFCNIMIGSDDRLLLSHEGQQELLAKLKLMGKTYSFTVDPQRLSTNFPEKRYLSSNGLSYTQCPILGSSESVGREVYLSKDNVFTHYCTSTRDVMPQPRSTKVDRYEFLELHEKHEINVEVRGKYGFTILQHVETDQPLQVFSQIDFSLHTLRIYTKLSIEGNKPLLRALNLKSYLSNPHKLSDTMLTSSYSFPTSMELDTKDVFEDSESSISSDDDLEDPGGPSDESDAQSDYSDFPDDLSVTEEEMITDAKDDGDVGTDDDSDDDDRSSLPSSTSGLVRPSLAVIDILRMNAVRYVSDSMLDIACEQSGIEFAAGYEIDIPFDPGVSRVYDSEDQSAWEMLEEQLQALPEEEYDWSMVHIKTCLAQFGPIKSVVSRLDTVRQTARKVQKRTPAW